MWDREVPSEGRLIRSVRQSNVSLFIGEFRLRPDAFRLPTWSEDEPGISIAALVLSVNQSQGLSCEWCLPRGFLGRHAIARWYQRAVNATPEALIVDLIRLSAEVPDVLADGADGVLISTTNGGAWRGALVPGLEGDDGPLLRVQSFY